MKQAVLTRFFRDQHQSLGSLISKEGLPELFVCKTLELTWKNNISNVSCVPTGIFLCKWTRSTRLSLEAGRDVYTYELIDVPQRGGIRIHSANFFKQLKGCIALGDTHKDINADNELDIIHSGATIKQFNEMMDKEDFLLTIRDEIFV